MKPLRSLVVPASIGMVTMPPGPEMDLTFDLILPKFTYAISARKDHCPRRASTVPMKANFSLESRLPEFVSALISPPEGRSSCVVLRTLGNQPLSEARQAQSSGGAPPL